MQNVIAFFQVYFFVDDKTTVAMSEKRKLLWRDHVGRSNARVVSLSLKKSQITGDISSEKGTFGEDLYGFLVPFRGQP